MLEKIKKAEADVKNAQRQLIATKKDVLKEMLANCSPGEQKMFYRMYGSFGNNIDVFTVVNGMKAKNLDCALEQVQATINKKVFT